jgi:hypothetical protein
MSVASFPTVPVMGAKWFSSRQMAGRSTRGVPRFKARSDATAIRKGDFVFHLGTGVIRRAAYSSFAAGGKISDATLWGVAGEWDSSQVALAPFVPSPPADLYYDSTGMTFSAGTNEVQTITAGTASGGTFTLTIYGVTTAAIAYNAAASVIDAALEAILGAGTVTAAGGALGTNPVTVTFTGMLASTNVPPLLVNGANLTGGTAPTVAETTPGVAPVGMEMIVCWPADGQHVWTLPLADGETLSEGLVGSTADIALDADLQNRVQTTSVTTNLVKIVGVHPASYSLVGSIRIPRLDIMVVDSKSQYLDVIF